MLVLFYNFSIGRVNPPILPKLFTALNKNYERHFFLGKAYILSSPIN